MGRRGEWRDSPFTRRSGEKGSKTPYTLHPTPYTLICEQCGARPAVVRCRMQDGAPQALCEACFRAQRLDLRLDLARFFVLLTRPRLARSVPELPWMPPDTVCPECGLRYAEFAAQGLVGCAACYAAFAPAIVPALDILRQGMNE